jgi:hypothetical protein
MVMAALDTVSHRPTCHARFKSHCNGCVAVRGYMRKAGVEPVQGYLFSKPVPVCEFARASAPMLTALVA